ncbi:hypothetical protein T439DRAFT_351160 [Meredithblackwellia eburnea MCA 4105]
MPPTPMERNVESRSGPFPSPTPPSRSSAASQARDQVESVKPAGPNEKTLSPEDEEDFRHREKVLQATSQMAQLGKVLGTTAATFQYTEAHFQSASNLALNAYWRAQAENPRPANYQQIEDKASRCTKAMTHWIVTRRGLEDEWKTVKKNLAKLEENEQEAIKKFLRQKFPRFIYRMGGSWFLYSFEGYFIPDGSHPERGTVPLQPIVMVEIAPSRFREMVQPLGEPTRLQDHASILGLSAQGSGHQLEAPRTLTSPTGQNLLPSASNPLDSEERSFTLPYRPRHPEGHSAQSLGKRHEGSQINMRMRAARPPSPPALLVDGIAHCLTRSGQRPLQIPGSADATKDAPKDDSQTGRSPPPYKWESWPRDPEDAYREIIPDLEWSDFTHAKRAVHHSVNAVSSENFVGSTGNHQSRRTMPVLKYSRTLILDIKQFQPIMQKPNYLQNIEARIQEIQASVASGESTPKKGFADGETLETLKAKKDLYLRFIEEAEKRRGQFLKVLSTNFKPHKSEELLVVVEYVLKSLERAEPFFAALHPRQVEEDEDHLMEDAPAHALSKSGVQVNKKMRDARRRLA